MKFDGPIAAQRRRLVEIGDRQPSGRVNPVNLVNPKRPAGRYRISGLPWPRGPPQPKKDP